MENPRRPGNSPGSLESQEIMDALVSSRRRPAASTTGSPSIDLSVQRLSTPEQLRSNHPGSHEFETVATGVCSLARRGP